MENSYRPAVLTFRQCLIFDRCEVSQHVWIYGAVDILSNKFQSLCESEFHLVESFEQVQAQLVIVNIIVMQSQVLIDFDFFLLLEFIILKRGEDIREVLSLIIGEKLRVFHGCGYVLDHQILVTFVSSGYDRALCHCWYVARAINYLIKDSNLDN